MKRNILTLITSSYGGGAERLILNQMNSYNPNIFNLQVITFRKGQLEEDFKKASPQYFSLDTKCRLSLFALLRLFNYIRKNNIELVHAHLMESEIYATLLKIINPRIKVIITKHNANEFRKKMVWRVINKISSLFANKIICVSNEIKNFSIKYEFIDPKKIIVCPNGITITPINQLKIKENLRLKEDLHLHKNDFVIGIVGRLTPQKGHIFLIKAVELLHQKIPSIRLLVIGDGELRKELEEKVRDSGLENNVTFLGFRNDTQNLYHIMNILCIPSLWEGLSLVLLEAMETGTFVIMSDLPNNQEVAVQNKEGVYFKKGDYQELAKKIEHFYYHPEEMEKIENNARKKIIEEFDWFKNLKKIEDTYLEVLK